MIFKYWKIMKIQKCSLIIVWSSENINIFLLFSPVSVHNTITGEVGLPWGLKAAASLSSCTNSRHLQGPLNSSKSSVWSSNRHVMLSNQHQPWSVIWEGGCRLQIDHPSLPVSAVKVSLMSEYCNIHWIISGDDWIAFVLEMPPPPSIQPASGTLSYFRHFLEVFTLFWPPHAGGRWATLSLGKGGVRGGRGGGSGSRRGKIRRRRNRPMKKADNGRISGVSLISCRRVCVQALIGSQEQFYRIWTEKEEDNSVFCCKGEADEDWQRGLFSDTDQLLSIYPLSYMCCIKSSTHPFQHF